MNYKSLILLRNSFLKKKTEMIVFLIWWYFMDFSFHVENQYEVVASDEANKC